MRKKKSQTLVASVAAFNEDGHLLFGLRSDAMKFTLPGGHLEEGEEPVRGALRELREEAGLRALSLEFLGEGVVRREAGDIRVYAFKAKVTGKPHGDDDPDQECQTWRFVDVSHGLPEDIGEHLYNRNNITLRLLGLQPGEVRKAEQVLRKDDSAPAEDEISQLLDSKNGADRTMALKLPGVEKRHLLRAASSTRGSYPLVQEILQHPLYDADVADRILNDYWSDSHGRYNVLRDERGVLGPEALEPYVQAMIEPRRDLEHETPAYSDVRYPHGHGSLILEHPKLSPEQIKRLATGIKDHVYSIGGKQLADVIARRPDIPPETLQDIVREGLVGAGKHEVPPAGPRAQALISALQHPRLPEETIQEALNYRDREPPHMGGKPERFAAPAVEEALAKNPSLKAEHLTKLIDHQRGTGIYHPANNPFKAAQIAALTHPNLKAEHVDMALRNMSPEVREAALRRNDLVNQGHIDTAIKNGQPSDLLWAAENPSATPEQLNEITKLTTDPQSAFATGYRRTHTPGIHSVLMKNPKLSPEALTTLIDANMDKPHALADSLKNPNLKPEHVSQIVRAVQGGYEYMQPASQASLVRALMETRPDLVTDEHRKAIARAGGLSMFRDALDATFSKKHNIDPKLLHEIATDPEGEFVEGARSAAMSHPNASVDTARDIIQGRAFLSDRVKAAAVSHPQLTADDLRGLASTTSNPHVLDNILLHPSADSDVKLKALAGNNSLAENFLRHGDQNVQPEHVAWGLKHEDDSVRAAAVGHPLAPREAVLAAVNDPAPNVSGTALNSGRIHEQELRELAEKHRNSGVRSKAAEILAKESPDSVFNERVGVRLGTNKLRKIRDLILSKKGRTSMHPKELPPGDWSAGRGPDGNIHADRLQAAIDAAEPMNFNISHSKWTGAQRHNNAPSKVLQLNLTSDQIRKMKDAGVYGTFRNMQEASAYSSHPVAKHHGIGWVRYTGNARDGYFVDEVQSDFGQSFVRQAAAQAKAQGQDPEYAAAQAQQKYPEEHFKLISQILFKGKHPNEVLHEAFLQHLRDKNQHNAKVQIHSVESKAPISLGKPLSRVCKHCGKPEKDHIDSLLEQSCASCGLPRHKHLPGVTDKFVPGGKAEGAHNFEPGSANRLEAPGHFNVTYHDVPKKMGAEPSEYGKLKTQSNTEMKGAPTWEMKVRKAERKFEDELQIWLAQQPLAKMAVRPEDMKSISRYHEPRGHDFVDHSKEFNQHPASNEAGVGLFRHQVIENPKPVKRGRTGTREQSNSTGKAVYDVDAGQEKHRFMVKPYHEKIVPKVRAWMHNHPIQGWAEMTNQALYHAGGIGHLHQRVHVAEVPVPLPKNELEARRAKWVDEFWTPERSAQHVAEMTTNGKDQPTSQSTALEGFLREKEVQAPTHRQEPVLAIQMDKDVVPARSLLNQRRVLPTEVREQAKKIGLMDFLTNNLDRHLDNLLWDEKGQRLIGIDHSRSFQYKAADKGWNRNGTPRPKNAPLEDSLSNYIREGAVDTVDPRRQRPEQIDPQKYNPMSYHNGEARRVLEEWGPVFEWWDKNKDAIRDTMNKRLALIKDSSVREHVRRNFDARWNQLNQYAQFGHENFGFDDWDQAKVPIFRYGTKDHEE